VVLNAWLKELASGDQRRPMGNGSALEALRDDALYKSTLFTLLYFNGVHKKSRKMYKP